MVVEIIAMHTVNFGIKRLIDMTSYQHKQSCIFSVRISVRYEWRTCHKVNTCLIHRFNTSSRSVDVENIDEADLGISLVHNRALCTEVRKTQKRLVHNMQAPEASALTVKDGSSRIIICCCQVERIATIRYIIAWSDSSRRISLDWRETKLLTFRISNQQDDAWCSCIALRHDVAVPSNSWSYTIDIGGVLQHDPGRRFWRHCGCSYPRRMGRWPYWRCIPGWEFGIVWSNGCECDWNTWSTRGVRILQNRCLL